MSNVEYASLKCVYQKAYNFYSNEDSLTRVIDMFEMRNGVWSFRFLQKKQNNVMSRNMKGTRNANKSSRACKILFINIVV